MLEEGRLTIIINMQNYFSITFKALANKITNFDSLMNNGTQNCWEFYLHSHTPNYSRCSTQVNYNNGEKFSPGYNYHLMVVNPLRRGTQMTNNDKAI